MNDKIARLRMLEAMYRFDLDELSHADMVRKTAALAWNTTDPVVFISARIADGDQLLTTTSDVTGHGDQLASLIAEAPHKDVEDCALASAIYDSAMDATRRGKLNAPLTRSGIACTRARDMRGFFGGTQEAGFVGLFATTAEVRLASRGERSYWAPIAEHLARRGGSGIGSRAAPRSRTSWT